MIGSWKSLWQGIRRTLLTGIVAAVLVCLLLPLTYDRRVSRAEAPMSGSATEREPETCELTTPHIVDAGELSSLFRRAAQKALPAVVVIKTSYSPVCPRCGRAHEPNDTESEEEVTDETNQRSLEILGSGFIVDPTGVVLTNKHVVRGNTRLMVQTVDGRQYTVRHIRIDKENDAAVLHIESPTPLPYLSLGDSDPVQIGDWVLTIGCPLELDQTVSAGIISARIGRSARAIGTGSCKRMRSSIPAVRVAHSSISAARQLALLLR